MYRSQAADEMFAKSFWTKRMQHYLKKGESLLEKQDKLYTITFRRCDKSIYKDAHISPLLNIATQANFQVEAYRDCLDTQ